MFKIKIQTCFERSEDKLHAYWVYSDERESIRMGKRWGLEWTSSNIIIYVLLDDKVYWFSAAFWCSFMTTLIMHENRSVHQYAISILQAKHSLTRLWWLILWSMNVKTLFGFVRTIYWSVLHDHLCPFWGLIFVINVTSCLFLVNLFFSFSKYSPADSLTRLAFISN